MMHGRTSAKIHRARQPFCPTCPSAFSSHPIPPHPIPSHPIPALLVSSSALVSPHPHGHARVPIANRIVLSLSAAPLSSLSHPHTHLHLLFSSVCPSVCLFVRSVLLHRTCTCHAPCLYIHCMTSRIPHCLVFHNSMQRNPVYRIPYTVYRRHPNQPTVRRTPFSALLAGCQSPFTSCGCWCSLRHRRPRRHRLKLRASAGSGFGHGSPARPRPALSLSSPARAFARSPFEIPSGLRPVNLRTTLKLGPWPWPLALDV
ncbi:hypothetical protein C8Q74DRAFT_506964 [Fomes fomentarius]|nr:hypothetical protein C8Q74DRAFT_506964 [Fomes fomentarius]